MTPETCPSYKSDLTGEPIPEKDREVFGYAKNFSRVIGVYDRGKDRTAAWRCPDCGYEWPRK